MLEHGATIFALEHAARWNIFALEHIRAGPIRSQSFALEHAALGRFAVKNHHRKERALRNVQCPRQVAYLSLLVFVPVSHSNNKVMIVSQGQPH